MTNLRSRPPLAILLVAGITAAACAGQSPPGSDEGPGDQGRPAASAASGRSEPGSRPGTEGRLEGTVSDTAGRPLAGVFVTARAGASAVAVSVLTDAGGGYELPVAPGDYRVEAHGRGYRSDARDPVPAAAGAGLDFTLARDPGILEPATSSAWLRRLPDGETKRRFILDCTGCHQFATPVVEVAGRPRTRDEWQAAVEKMLSFAGAETGFPIISPEREPAATADWLSGALAAGREGTPTGSAAPSSAGSARAERGAADPVRPDSANAIRAAEAVFTEYDVPHPDDLPHDLMLDGAGRVIVTGMFSHVMYRLDPASGVFEEIPIPVPQANPRALEIDGSGIWWVLLGGPHQIARFDPADGSWKSYDIGLYPHSIARTADGGIWFNGHFTKDPIRLGRLDPSSGDVRSYDLPPNPWTVGSPIPYEIRAAADGALWGSELVGNRIYRFDPKTGEAEFFTMPAPFSGPRRLDVAPDGTVWIPAYSGGSLVAFDPRTKRFTEHPLPTPDALPYVARVAPGGGAVWVAEAAGDAIARFEPATGRWIEFPLPTGSSLIRHMDIDPKTGAVWAAYANAPAVTPKILRLELRSR
jgi:virginiamycin B lyase